MKIDHGYLACLPDCKTENKASRANTGYYSKTYVIALHCHDELTSAFTKALSTTRILTSGESAILRDHIIPPLRGPTNRARDTVDCANPFASGT